MLVVLKVKDFALIDELEVEFKEGLNVITGETGAGKSIIINAISSLINGKSSVDAVRTGAKQAEVSGEFSDGVEDSILRRITNSSGRSRAFINGDAVTVNKLEREGNRLISIYGQNEFQYLLSKDSYIVILDNLLSLEAQRKFLGEKVESLKATHLDLSARNKEADGKEREISFVEFQIDEIDRARLKKDEEEGMKERLRLLKDAEKIKAILDMIAAGFYEGDSSIHGMCKTFLALLRPFSGMEIMRPLKEKVEAVVFDAEDALGEAKSVERSLSYDPEELQMIQERLSLIYTLKNKYGRTLEDIAAHRDRAMERRTYLTGLADEIERLNSAEENLRREVEVIAQELSRNRHEGAREIEKEIIDELAFLSMKGLRFAIIINDKGTIDEDGKDDVEFMISTNLGEPLKPLRKIASGGELSRIMLAIKKVIGGEEEKTLIFDEVDAGIGGRVADMVGRRLKTLAQKHQILCITHLPQIAVYGDHHFLVEKSHGGGITRTTIRELSEKERVVEIARMMGGETITEKTLQGAEEMLQHA
jgi:DNA repair protein RecN (Recombination protein N)